MGKPCVITAAHMARKTCVPYNISILDILSATSLNYCLCGRILLIQLYLYGNGRHPHKQAYAKGQGTNDAVQVVKSQRVVHPSTGTEGYKDAWYALEIFYEAHAFFFEHHVRLHYCAICLSRQNDCINGLCRNQLSSTGLNVCL